MAFDEEYLRGLWNEIFVISEKDEVLRISHAVMSELFDRRLALPQYARSGSAGVKSWFPLKRAEQLRFSAS